jgi:uncharacterized repeat protein (TIGR03803 family)
LADIKQLSFCEDESTVNPDRKQSRRIRVSNRTTSTALCLLILLTLTIGASRNAVAQSYNVIHNFVGGGDGSEPAYGDIIDGSGNIFGSTFSGDAGTGTIFEMSRQGSSWTSNTIYMFTGGLDGAVPYGGVIFGPDGSLYGTTAFGGYGPCSTWGGKTGCGTVFKLQQSGGSWTESVLFYFQQGPEGGTPYGGKLIFDQAGNLYGTTFSGGTGPCPGGCGVVFELSPSGSGWTEKVLYTFLGGNDAAQPWAGVNFDPQGNLYGTTEFGGSSNVGTIYKLTPSGSGWTESVLYTFHGQSDGQKPLAGLTFDNSGNMYGATSGGGANNGGTIFKLTPSGNGWNFQTVFSFSGAAGQFANGPVSNLVIDPGGNIWGVTGGDGTSQKGTVFRLTPTTSGLSLTTLYSFAGGADGGVPRANLVFDGNGNMYGTAAGGNNLPACIGTCGVAFEVTNPQQFVSVPPCRVVDTRNPNGPLGGPPIQGQTSRSFPITGNCGIPVAAASAISANVTVIPNGQLQYLTVWPTGQQQPQISLMNSDGRTKANAAVLQAGLNGNVSVYASNTTNLVIDVNGYYVLPGATPQGSSPLTFYPLTPCRVVDTRGPSGPLGGPALVGGQERDFPVQQASGCGIPSSAKEYSLNVTALPHGPLQYLTAWPAGQQRPTISTLNAPTGTTTANAAVIGVGTGGSVAVYPTNNTDLLIDINGYFAAPGPTGLSLYPTPPCRVLDTRNGNGAFSGELTVDVVDSPCTTPTNAGAYVLNATVIPQGPLGYLTLWADGGTQPVVSTLNATDGAITSNMAIVPTTNGSIDAYASSSTQLILDISSYFAP